MSDETNLPPLRLKPRHRADSPPPAVPAEAAPAAATPPDASSPAPDPARPAPAPAPILFAPAETPAVAVPPPVVLPPAPTPPPPAAKAPSGDTLDLGRLKLKPRVASTEPSAVLPPAPASTATAAPLPAAPSPAIPVAPPPAVAAVVPPPAMPPPAAAPLLPPIAPSTAKPPPFIRAKTDGGKSLSGKVSPEDSPAFRAGVWIFVGVVVVALAGIGFLGYRFLSAKNEKKAAVAAQSRPAPVPKPAAAAPAAAAPTATPAPAAAAKPSVLATKDPQSTAGKLIAKAEATIAEREQSGQVQGVDQVLDAKPAAAHPAAAPATAPTAEAKPAAKSPSETTDAAAKPAAPAKVEPAAPAPEPIVLVAPKAKPSAAFRVFVVNARVSGVFQGDPGRVLLNGRMFRVGEIVEPQLGIRLTRLDVERKMLHFEDVAGAEMERHY